MRTRKHDDGGGTVVAASAENEEGRNRYRRVVDNRKLMTFLEQERMKRGWLMSQFAEHAQIGATTYTNWIKNHNIAPSTAILYQLAQAYSFDIKKLYALLDIETGERGI